MKKVAQSYNGVGRQWSENEDDNFWSAAGWTGRGGEEVQVEGRRLEAGSCRLRLWYGAVSQLEWQVGVAEGGG